MDYGGNMRVAELRNENAPSQIVELIWFVLINARWGV